MPELPEVQTVVNDLNKKVIGEQIVGFESFWKKNVRPSFPKFKKKVLGTKIKNAKRIGKHIVIDLDNNFSILIHLKMTGHLLYKLTANSLQSTAGRSFGSAKTSSLRERSPKQSKKEQDYFNEKVNQYIRHKLFFKSGAVLEFSDLRKFGWLNLVNTENIEDEVEIKKLGIDAMNKKFTVKVFEEILDKKDRGMIGTTLLDQELIAGIGNIYRSEILFNAGVLPQRKIYSLNQEEKTKIFNSIKKILKKAIKMRGTSDVDYRDTEGKKGNFQNVLMVYRREEEPCKLCGAKIIREKIGQRSVFYCPVCQK